MIEAAGLTKKYSDKVAVDQLTFQVRPGVVTGFLGPNGAGKSTTMRMILGLDRPTAGRSMIMGRAYRSFARPLCHVGALIESDSIHPGRSARNHLRAAARSNGISMSRVDRVLEEVGLAEVAGRRVKTYSLGMRQRLGMAAALLGDPEVLLFDEPINGLDADGIRWVRHLVRRLAAEGRTVFVSSHMLGEMQQTADHLLVLGRGRLIADASTTDVLSRGGRRTVRVRSSHPDRLTTVLRQGGGQVEGSADAVLLVGGLTTETIGDLARGAGVTIHELSDQPTSLEQVYLELTGESLDYSASAPATEAQR